MIDITRPYTHTRMWEINAKHLLMAMEREGINQSQLAERVGVKQPSIGRLISGETRTTRALDRIAAALKTTPQYLRGETDDPDCGFVPVIVETREAVNPDMVELDELDLAFGLGATFIDAPVKSKKVIFSRNWLRTYTQTPPENLFFARGIGDSMMPTIFDSDELLIDRAQVAPQMGDHIWAIAYGQTGMIKRLRPMPNGSVKILSDNPSVPPEIAYDGEMHVLGRVVAVVRKV
ncbi:helix-turn-helix transcriptional regulator [Novosphingobium umbonatum]|uniref:Helix-turn-helix transcriptional regulator n=1 Tax=Novosphingobium umbonatum TaxID=1908524 RepID=A0A437N1W2_9SPHN|nr:S24 family peptidase [Novosphingobium umbonatum]RVU03911.1 helix-turn-helix transcriptional regulator [Novosphingobium umbonatum]